MGDFQKLLFSLFSFFPPFSPFALNSNLDFMMSIVLSLIESIFFKCFDNL